MAITELCLDIMLGVGFLVLLIFALTLIITVTTSRKLKSIKNVYLGYLQDDDLPISSAVKYLKLTNSVKNVYLGYLQDDDPPISSAVKYLKLTNSVTQKFGEEESLNS